MYHANVSTAINGASNGQIAVPTRPHAATAIAPNSKNSNISFHLLCHLLFLSGDSFYYGLYFNMFDLFLIFFQWNFFFRWKLSIGIKCSIC